MPLNKQQQYGNFFFTCIIPQPQKEYSVEGLRRSKHHVRGSDEKRPDKEVNSN